MFALQMQFLRRMQREGLSPAAGNLRYADAQRRGIIPRDPTAPLSSEAIRSLGTAGAGALSTFLSRFAPYVTAGRGAFNIGQSIADRATGRNRLRASGRVNIGVGPGGSSSVDMTRPPIGTETTENLRRMLRGGRQLGVYTGPYRPPPKPSLVAGVLTKIVDDLVDRTRIPGTPSVSVAGEVGHIGKGFAKNVIEAAHGTIALPGLVLNAAALPIDVGLEQLQHVPGLGFTTPLARAAGERSAKTQRQLTDVASVYADDMAYRWGPFFRGDVKTGLARAMDDPLFTLLDLTVAGSAARIPGLVAKTRAPRLQRKADRLMDESEAALTRGMDAFRDLRTNEARELGRKSVRLSQEARRVAEKAERLRAVNSALPAGVRIPGTNRFTRVQGKRYREPYRRVIESRPVNAKPGQPKSAERGTVTVTKHLPPYSGNPITRAAQKRLDRARPKIDRVLEQVAGIERGVRRLELNDAVLDNFLSREVRAEAQLRKNVRNMAFRRGEESRALVNRLIPEYGGAIRKLRKFRRASVAGHTGLSVEEYAATLHLQGVLQPRNGWTPKMLRDRAVASMRKNLADYEAKGNVLGVRAAKRNIEMIERIPRNLLTLKGNDSNVVAVREAVEAGRRLDRVLQKMEVRSGAVTKGTAAHRASIPSRVLLERGKHVTGRPQVRIDSLRQALEDTHAARVALSRKVDRAPLREAVKETRAAARAELAASRRKAMFAAGKTRSAKGRRRHAVSEAASQSRQRSRHLAGVERAARSQGRDVFEQGIRAGRAEGRVLERTKTPERKPPARQQGFDPQGHPVVVEKPPAKPKPKTPNETGRKPRRRRLDAQERQAAELKRSRERRAKKAAADARREESKRQRETARREAQEAARLRKEVRRESIKAERELRAEARRLGKQAAEYSARSKKAAKPFQPQAAARTVRVGKQGRPLRYAEHAERNRLLRKARDAHVAAEAIRRERMLTDAATKPQSRNRVRDLGTYGVSPKRAKEYERLFASNNRLRELREAHRAAREANVEGMVAAIERAALKANPVPKHVQRAMDRLVSDAERAERAARRELAKASVAASGGNKQLATALREFHAATHQRVGKPGTVARLAVREVRLRAALRLAERSIVSEWMDGPLIELRNNSGVYYPHSLAKPPRSFTGDYSTMRGTKGVRKPKESHGVLIGVGAMDFNPALLLRQAERAASNRVGTTSYAALNELIGLAAFRNKEGKFITGPRAAMLFRQDEGKVALVNAAHLRRALDHDLEQLRHGEWADPKAFEHVFVSDLAQLESIKNIDRNYVAISRAAYEEWVGTATGSNMILKAWDSALDVWKGAILAFTPRWYVNSAFGAMQQYGLLSVYDIRSIFQANRMGPIRRVLPSEAVLATFAEEVGWKNGFSMGGLGRAMNIGFMVNTRMEATWRRAAYLNRAKAALRGEGVKVGKLSDMELAHALTSMPESMVRSIIRDVDFFMGDFRRFNTFERTVIKRFIPFYSWFRVISKLTFGLPFRSPLRAWALFTLSKAASSAVNPNDYMLPWAYRDAIRIPGTDIRIRTNAMDSFKTLIPIIDSFTMMESPNDLQKPLLAAGEWWHPLIRGVSTYMYGLNDFGDPLKAPGGGRNHPKLNEYTGTVYWDSDAHRSALDAVLATMFPGQIGTLKRALAGNDRVYDTATLADLLLYRAGLKDSENIVMGQSKSKPSGITKVGPGAIATSIGSFFGITPFRVDFDQARARYEEDKRKATKADKKQVETFDFFPTENSGGGETFDFFPDD